MTGVFRHFRSLSLMLFLSVMLAGCRSAGKPVVGISSSWDDARVVSLNDSYVAAVRAAGGVPVVLPPVRSAAEAAEALALADALILSGGEDVDPARYGEAVLDSTVEVNAPRDTSDFLLAAEAMRRGIPILGICRGSQLLNVFFGGSLYQDLPGQIGSLPESDGESSPCQVGTLPESDGGPVRGGSGGSAVHGSFLSGPVRGGSEVDGTADAACQGHAAIRHRQNESGSVGTHWIYIDPDSHLHCLLGRDSVMVNSFHHQAVKDPGTGVRVVARAADGVVEAWEWDAPQRTGSSKRGSLQHSGSSRRDGSEDGHTDSRQPHGSILCVQFHPEIFVKAGDPTFLPLFQDLIDRAR